MNIETKLQEVGDYFKSKLVQGNYEFLSTEPHTARIKIDDKYTFHVWKTNDPKYFDFYLGDVSNGFQNDHMKFTNEEDRIEAYSKLKFHLEEGRKKYLESELKEIQDKLNNL